MNKLEAPKTQTFLTEGALIPGQQVVGYTLGTHTHGGTYQIPFSGRYVGSWMDEGELYDNFENGRISGYAQRVFGAPASHLPEGTERTIIPLGTVLSFGGEQVKIGKRGARILK